MVTEFLRGSDASAEGRAGRGGACADVAAGRHGAPGAAAVSPLPDAAHRRGSPDYPVRRNHHREPLGWPSRRAPGTGVPGGNFPAPSCLTPSNTNNDTFAAKARHQVSRLHQTSDYFFDLPSARAHLCTSLRGLLASATPSKRCA